tara:strand:- start:291 stop:488 length:198 start_codon:yes stop_codon:yes gene_type:complete
MRLIIVSIRVALPSDGNQSSAGGLSVGLKDALNEASGICFWVKWKNLLTERQTRHTKHSKRKNKI